VCDLEDIGEPSIFRLIHSDPVSGRMLSTLRLELVVQRRTSNTRFTNHSGSGQRF
jgi:hypothetical protein